MQSFIERTVADDPRAVGKRRVICGLSGGVDSSVCAALLLEGDRPAGRLHLRRQRPAAAGRGRGGPPDVPRHFTADLHVVDAREPFLDALAGVTDPQEKRRIIGHVFIDVFKDEAKSIQDARFLAQGTLYPDVIESGGAADGPAATIKTHHNVGGLPGRARLRADRAAQGPVQGRGAPARPGTRACRRRGLAASVPRPRPGGALPGPGDARSGSRCCARPTHSCWKS